MTGMSSGRKVLHLKKRKLFLEELARSGNVSAAADFAGLNRNDFYDIRKVDAEFAAAWEVAIEQAADALELEARRRAYHGVEEPVFGRVARDRDDKIGTVQKYSDTLLIFLLKGVKPDKYRERRDVTANVKVASIADLVAEAAKEGDGKP